MEKLSKISDGEASKGASETIHIRVDKDFKSQLERHVRIRSVVEDSNLTISEVVREVVKNYLDAYEEELLLSAKKAIVKM